MSICWWCMYEAKIFKISLLFKHHPPSSMLIILFVYMSRHCSRPLHCQTSFWSLRSNWLLPSVSKEEIFFRYCQQALMMMASELWASWNSSQTKSLRSQFFVDFSLIPLLLGHIKDHKTSFCRKVRDEKNTHENLKLLLLFAFVGFHMPVQASKATSNTEQTCTQASHCRDVLPRADCSVNDPPSTKSFCHLLPKLV